MHGDEYRARKGGLQPGLTFEDPWRQGREIKVEKDFGITLEQRLADLADVGLESAFEERARRNGGREW